MFSVEVVNGSGSLPVLLNGKVSTIEVIPPPLGPLGDFDIDINDVDGFPVANALNVAGELIMRADKQLFGLNSVQVTNAVNGTYRFKVRWDF